MPTETVYDLSGCACCGHPCQACEPLLPATLFATLSGAFSASATLTAVALENWESEEVTCGSCSFYVYMTCTGADQIDIGVVVTAGGAGCAGCAGNALATFDCGRPFSATSQFVITGSCSCGTGTLTIDITE